MRINKFVALSTGMGRRAADAAIEAGRVRINNKQSAIGQTVTPTDTVTLDGNVIMLPTSYTTIILYKPVGYVCSRNGQGSKTVYDLLPKQLHSLKPVGRLDKDSSGLLLMTNDGNLAHELTHPSHHKTKIYDIKLDKPLMPLHRQMISDYGITLEDGLSKLQLERLQDGNETSWRVAMHEGRNRQIRRTFAALGYTVKKLHRIQFGTYLLNDLKPGEFQYVP